MEQIEIEPIRVEPPQAGLAGLDRSVPRRMVRQHFADEEDVRAAAGDGIADDLLGAAAPVHLCRVDERHPDLDAEAKRGKFAGAATAVFAHAPRTLTEHRHGFPRGQPCRADAARSHRGGAWSTHRPMRTSGFSAGKRKRCPFE